MKPNAALPANKEGRQRVKAKGGCELFQRAIEFRVDPIDVQREQEERKALKQARPRYQSARADPLGGISEMNGGTGKPVLSCVGVPVIATIPTPHVG